MHARELEAFLDLPEIRDAGARKALFRQTIATLSHAAGFGPSALDGISPPALERAVAAALNSGFFDDDEWLSADALAVALYELTHALPAGLSKRELGRRVQTLLTEGNVRVFVAIATRLARSSPKTLAEDAVHARVSLIFFAPAATLDIGPLAFALVAQRELASAWIINASTGPLPARRLAARILERAAAVAARRALEGDDYPPRVFTTEHLARAFGRLLADREPLVWRHAAVARGLLAGVASAPWKAVNEHLNPRLGATEWRRGAVSIVAAIGTAPERALERARELIRSPMASHDRGLVATMVHGLPRAYETEPEAGEQLLDAIVDADPAGAAESIAAVTRELSGDAGRRMIATARAVISDRLSAGIGDPVEVVLARALADELNPARSGEPTLRDAIARSVQRFVDVSARDAHQAALAALEIARDTMSALEGLDLANDASGIALTRSPLLLRDLDLGLLEEPTLGQLLQLGGKSDSANQALEELHERLGRWLIAHEQMVPPRDPRAIGTSGRHLRALLHLLDSEGSRTAEEIAPLIHRRRREAAAFLFDRLGSDPHSPLHRTISATLARALDGLVREGSCDPVDILLVAASRIGEPADIATLAEASMNPDVEGVLDAWATFMRMAISEEPESSKIEAIFEFAAALGDDGSGRAEGLRAVLMRIAQALRQLSQITARHEVAAAASALESLASAARAWLQAEGSALRRVLHGDNNAPAFSSTLSPHAVRIAAHLLRMADRPPESARAGGAQGVAELSQLLPPSLTATIGEVVRRVSELPYERALPRASVAPAFHPLTESLPAWLGLRRTIGGFYLVRPLGAGGAASVFVAKRIEERHDPSAEQFALKVPDYDGAAARSLSEQEFLAFFRAEASALLGLPADPNLARFVTFDLAARPKPILVMELIEGPTLERFITASTGTAMYASRAFEILDGVAAGLEVMHRHAIGHLDLKPSNVVLRDGRTPMLVDFGLAGRVLRPGCATGAYGAPEVWGVLPEDMRGDSSPMPADVYAFGALAFEVLTGHTLFDANTEAAVIGKHLVHDGHPPELDRLVHVRPLVEVLEHTLRRDPRKRWPIARVRHALQAINKVAGAFPWPL